MQFNLKWNISLALLCVAGLFLLSGCGAEDAQAADTPTAPTAAVSESTENTQPDTAPAAKTEQEVVEKPANDNTVTLDISMYDSYYGDSDSNMTEPPIWTVTTGKTILINIENFGDEKHNWAIIKKGETVPVPFQEGRNSPLIIVEPGMVYAKSKTTWVINAPEPGDYQVICTVSGHYPFMQGRLVVAE